jgi:hypothetical protein
MAMVKVGENSVSASVVETVGAALYPRLDRKDYGLWAVNMEVAMEAQEIRRSSRRRSTTPREA